MNAFYSELHSEGLLHIEGPDSQKFLQGQTTCDTRKLTTGQSLPGAYCNPQGRMICDFLLTALTAEHVLLRMRRSIIETAVATFGKYILFSKAEMDDKRDDWSVYGCWGEGAASVLKAIAGNLPTEAYTAAGTDGCVVIRMPGEPSCFEVYLQQDQYPEYLETLQQALQHADESAWQVLQIQAGVPRVEAATSGEFIPQLFNYDLTGHVSFNKGCYTGQEIVARLHYRGKPKQRTHLLEMAGAHDLPAGCKLFTPGHDNSTGTVLNSAVADDRTYCLAAVNAQGVSGGLQLQNDGPALRLLDLPYTLPA